MDTILYDIEATQVKQISTIHYNKQAPGCSSMALSQLTRVSSINQSLTF